MLWEVLLTTLDVWKSATTTSGALCAMTYSEYLMLPWPAGSWDSTIQVSS